MGSVTFFAQSWVGGARHERFWWRLPSGAGVQGFDWLVRRMREDEDGDVAEEFFHADDGTEADGALRVVRGTKAATVTQARAAAVPSPRR